MSYTAPPARIVTAGKGPPSAPPTIPPIIINPYRHDKPAPAIDPRVELPRPPVMPPGLPSLRM